MTFIVRLSIDDTGRVTGIVERVRTGQKERVQGVEAIGEVIARMAAGTERDTRITEGPNHDSES